MNTNLITLTIIALGIIAVPSITNADLLQSTNSSSSSSNLKAATDIGGLSFINFGSVWQDKVELYSLKSNNEYDNFVCRRNLDDCKLGSLEKPTGKISYQGNLELQTLYEDDKHSLHRINSAAGQQIVPVISKSIPKITRDESSVILIGSDKISRLNLKDKKLESSAIESFGSNLNILTSPSGNFVTGYDPDNKEFVIASLEADNIFKIPAGNYKNLNYAEMSPNEQYLAISNDLGTHDELELYKINKQSGAEKLKTLTAKGEAIDYLFGGDYLFYITNESDPYLWQLLAYNTNTQEVTVVNDNVVTNGYLRLIDDQLLYRVQEGLGSALYTLDIDSNDIGNASKKVMSAPKNNLSSSLQYDTYNLADDDFNGVLLHSDSDDNDDNKPLVVWLHGGPQSQARAGIHDARYNAQYDQLLEKLVSEHDVRVLKLDYPGSIGFGTNYTESLLGNMGTIDVAAVATAIEEVTDDYQTLDVHLIGHSYGGYLALKAAVELPSQVDNTIVISGVSDWQADLERDDTGGFSYIINIDESDRAKQYQQASVLDRLDNLNRNAKLGLVVGLNDKTVKPQQSYDVIDSIKANNIDIAEVKLLELEGEGHSPGKTDSLQKIYDLMVDFFTD